MQDIQIIITIGIEEIGTLSFLSKQPVMSLMLDSTFLLAHTIYNLYHSGITNFFFICHPEMMPELESKLNTMIQMDTSRLGLQMQYFRYQIECFDYDKKITPIYIIQKAINEKQINAQNLLIFPSNLYCDIIPQFITDNHRQEDAGLTIIFGNEPQFKSKSFVNQHVYRKGNMQDFVEGSIEIGKDIKPYYETGNKIYSLREVDYFQYLQKSQLTEDENNQILIDKQIINEREPKSIVLHTQRQCGILINSKIIQQLPQNSNLDLYQSLIQYVIEKYKQEQSQKIKQQQKQQYNTLQELCQQYYEKPFELEDLQQEKPSYKVISITFDKKYIRGEEKIGFNPARQCQEKMYNFIEEYKQQVVTKTMHTPKSFNQIQDVSQNSQKNKENEEKKKQSIKHDITKFNSGIMLLQNQYDYLYITYNILQFNYLRQYIFPTTTIKQQLIAFESIKQEQYKKILNQQNIYINSLGTFNAINYNNIVNSTIHAQRLDDESLKIDKIKKLKIQGTLKTCVVEQDVNIGDNIFLDGCIIMTQTNIQNTGTRILTFRDCIFGKGCDIQLSGNEYYVKGAYGEIFKTNSDNKEAKQGIIIGASFNYQSHLK